MSRWLDTDPELLALLHKAAQHVPTAQEIAAQRRAYVIAEMAMGDDQDEAIYRNALETGNAAVLAMCNAAMGERRRRARVGLADMGCAG